MMDQADVGNGTKKESRVGLAVSFVGGTLALAAIGYLTKLDLDSLPGWAAAAGTYAVSTGVGYLTAWKTKNAPAAYNR